MLVGREAKQFEVCLVVSLASSRTYPSESEWGAFRKVLAQSSHPPRVDRHACFARVMRQCGHGPRRLCGTVAAGTGSLAAESPPKNSGRLIPMSPDSLLRPLVAWSGGLGRGRF
jgi:hypothetical protein